MTFLGAGWASLVAHMVKHLLAMRETWVWSLGQKDPLEKEMATYSSTLAWKIPWMEEPGGLQSMGSQRVGHDWVISLFFHFFWLWEVLWSFFSVQLLSWLSYKVDFMLHVVIWSRSGSVLLRRVKEDSTSKQFFLFWGSSQGTHLLRFFIFPVYFKCWTTLEWITLSSLETSHVVIRGSASVMLSVGLCQLPVAIHCTPHLQSSHLLCKKLEPPLHGRFISCPGSNVLLMLWVVSAALLPILSSNKKIGGNCFLSNTISIV